VWVTVEAEIVCVTLFFVCTLVDVIVVVVFGRIVRTPDVTAGTVMVDALRTEVSVMVVVIVVIDVAIGVDVTVII